MREVVPTHSALLELREERAGMQESYRFLDEKRLVLAAEIVNELRTHQQMQKQLRVMFLKAIGALHAAIGRHGLEGLEVYPPQRLIGATLKLSPGSVLGVPVQVAELDLGESSPAWSCSNPSPEAERCKTAFAALMPLTAQLAAVAGNLERLRDEYRRTARRARALEDVLLPEIDETIASLELSLEDLDREDAVRVRHLHRKDSKALG